MPRLLSVGLNGGRAALPNYPVTYFTRSRCHLGEVVDVYSSQGIDLHQYFLISAQLDALMLLLLYAGH